MCTKNVDLAHFYSQHTHFLLARRNSHLWNLYVLVHCLYILVVA